jgi:hypothetical protein
MENRVEQCPLAIVAFARQRLASLAAAHLRDDRPWYLRWFVGQGVQSDPPKYADVKQFLECHLEERTCAGQLIGNWLVDETKILSSSAETNPNADFFRDKLVNYVETIIFNFALNSEKNKCVLVEIDLKGNVRRAAYKLPNGINGNALGPMIGELVRERVRRKL